MNLAFSIEFNVEAAYKYVQLFKSNYSTFYTWYSNVMDDEFYPLRLNIPITELKTEMMGLGKDWQTVEFHNRNDLDSPTEFSIEYHPTYNKLHFDITDDYYKLVEFMNNNNFLTIGNLINIDNTVLTERNNENKIEPIYTLNYMACNDIYYTYKHGTYVDYDRDRYCMELNPFASIFYTSYDNKYSSYKVVENFTEEELLKLPVYKTIKLPGGGIYIQMVKYLQPIGLDWNYIQTFQKIQKILDEKNENKEIKFR